MQASAHSWSPPGGVLAKILADSRARIAALSASHRAELERVASRTPSSPPPPSFAAALRTSTAVALIAEVKRRSPSKGEINATLSAGAQAEAYASGGAAAISVVTEPAHFGGSLADLAEAHRRVTLPLLRKDFVVDRTQLLEARLEGAAAVLLIARALPPARLCELAAEARELGIEPFVEIRSDRELERALESGAPAIGVNARDLETLEVDAAIVARLLPRVPGDRVAVAESGIRGRDGMVDAAALGADAVLVGSMLSASRDPAAAARALTGVPRTERRGA